MPAADVLLHIAQETNYSIHWLLTGVGEKFVTAEDAQQLSQIQPDIGNAVTDLIARDMVQIYEQMAEDWRTRLEHRVISRSAGPHLLKIQERIGATSLPDPIPEDARGSIELEDTALEGVRVPRLLVVAGDALRDVDLIEGDILLIGDSDDYQGRLVMAYVQGRGTLSVAVKIWRQHNSTVTLEPSNPDYPDSKIGPLPANMVDCAGIVHRVIRILATPQMKDLMPLAAQEEEREGTTMRMVRKGGKR